MIVTLTVTHSFFPTELDNNSGKTYTFELVISLVCAAIILFIFTCIYIGRRVYNKFKMYSPQLKPSTEFQLDLDRSIQEQVSELPYDLNWEFPRLDVTMGKVIGEGNFGEVWEAIAEGIGAFQPTDKSELSMRSKLSNLQTRENSENDFWVKYFRREYYPPEYSEGAQVAIKCLKPGASEEDYTDLASELKLMMRIGAH